MSLPMCLELLASAVPARSEEAINERKCISTALWTKEDEHNQAGGNNERICEI
jgi:hypothetical protein